MSRTVPSTLVTALRQMGYRHMGKGVWGKPVGYHLLTVHTKAKAAVFTNHFKGAKDQPLVWNRHGLDPEDYLSSLKFAERGTRLNMAQPSEYQFVTPDEQFADIL
jgi:hypothetical protein